MINNVNKNLYNTDVYKNVSKDIKPKINSNLNQINKSQNDQIIKLLNKMSQDIRKAEIIAIKIVRGEEVTPKEIEFIENNYPEINKVVKETVEKCTKLKYEISNYKTEEQKKQIISKEIDNVQNLDKKGLSNDINTRIKIAGLEEVSKFIKDIKLEHKKAEVIFSKLILGKYITTVEKDFILKKYPKLKRVIDTFSNEISTFKKEIKSSKTQEQRENISNQCISNIKNLDKPERIEVSKQLEVVHKLRVELKYCTSKEVKNILISKIIDTINTVTDSKQMKELDDIYEIQTFNEIVKEYKLEAKKESIVFKVIEVIDKLDESKAIEKFKVTNLISDIIENEALCEIYYRLKLIAIDEIERESKKYEEKTLYFNMGIYFYLYEILHKPLSIWIILITIILIFLIF